MYFHLLLLLAASPVTAEELENYSTVTGPCNLEFPRDHGDHPDYRTEWWYYTGNLQTESGDRYGFQLTFFRSRINPPGDDQKWPKPSSAWRTSQVYLAHAAVSDIAGKRHQHVETVARAALGMAGVDQSDPRTRIFLNNWSTEIAADNHRLEVISDEFSFAFNFRSAKPLVAHGDRGYSVKGSTPERASCYYSFTRLEGHGSIAIGGSTAEVSGTAWMDHEFSTALLEPGLTGWDWFSLQLSDQTEIMIFLLRQNEGGLHPASSGTFIDAAGRSHRLTKSDFKISVLETWRSRQSKARYPVKWRMDIAPLSLNLMLTANLPDQEMITLATTGTTYWEGSVSIKGSKESNEIDGVGYVELTGYAGSFDALM